MFVNDAKTIPAFRDDVVAELERRSMYYAQQHVRTKNKHKKETYQQIMVEIQDATAYFRGLKLSMGE